VTTLPARVRIYEVGPRDGLQNESVAIPTAAKAEYVRRLLAAGLQDIEATSFVSPAAVPQLADADELLPALTADQAARFVAMVPNERGLERALAAGSRAIAVFTAASDAFTERNIGMTVRESIEVFRGVIARARGEGLWTRGYVSTALGCPFTGTVDPARVVEVALELGDLGTDEVCLGDTIGVGIPTEVRELTHRLLDAGLPASKLAWHFHDTRGTAIGNVVSALEAGVTTIDASTGGTGGCPFAPGAAGNLATEDLVYLLDRLGIDHGVRLEAILDAARFIAEALGRPLASKVGQAGGWDPRTGAATGREPA
jgi:isopropylmalate/homocitrate/citramalate synthase